MSEMTCKLCGRAFSVDGFFDHDCTPEQSPPLPAVGQEPSAYPPVADVVTQPKVTQRRGESPADTCRRLGWGPGTRVVGDEGYGPTVIEITAVGERQILAKPLSHKGVPERYQREGSWVLSCRDWTPDGGAS